MNGTLQWNFEETATANRGRYTRGRDRPGCQHPSPRKEEIIAATKSLKNGKSPGKDNISAEVFQRDPQLAADLLKPLITDVWEGKRLSEDWTEGVIVKIPKKGVLSNCNNWRGINLLSVPRKILVKIVIPRTADTVDQQLCIDHIFILPNIIEQRTERRRQLKINFLEFEKAFHSMYLESLWRIVQACGMLQQIIDIIESFYNNFTCRVGNSETSFPVKSGVRRGCTMSEMLST